MLLQYYHYDKDHSLMLEDASEMAARQRAVYLGVCGSGKLASADQPYTTEPAKRATRRHAHGPWELQTRRVSPTGDKCTDMR